MNKQNKLARNAIRIRKAQAKRENEPNKPKKGRKWYSRLFALVGCLLLVSALVVPCVAFSEPTIDPAILTAFEDEYASSYVIYNNTAYNLMRPYVMDSYMLFGGSVSTTNVILMSFSYSSPVSMSVTIPSVRYSYSASIEQGDGGFGSTSEGYIELTVSMGNVGNYPDYGTFQIAFFESESGSEGVLELLIEGNLRMVTLQMGSYIEAEPSVATIDDTPWAFGRELDWLDLCVGFTDIYQVGFPMVNLLTQLLYGSVTDSYVLYPATFKQAYIYALNNASDSAEAYQRGFNDGYDDGYTTAVNEIESGDFGRNFLGDIFGNLTVSLNEFRLFQYDGTWVTLGSVLAASIGISLFIWLLKCMAGG